MMFPCKTLGAWVGAARTVGAWGGVTLGLAVAGGVGSAAPHTLYDSGDPTGQEQYVLELVNAARMDPAGEGRRLADCQDGDVRASYAYYGVNAGALAGTFAAYPSQPPLAMNARLLQSSRQQAQDQAARGVQSHVSGAGADLTQRLQAVGYEFSVAGENTYAYVTRPWYGHVGLNVDWGVPDLDHRENIMNYGSYQFREVGVAVVPTSVPNFGPLVLTQDFGTPADGGQAFLVGVVYDDRNGNGAYDEGEGLGGVTITPDQGDFYAVTGSAGGFAIPLPAGASGLTVTAAGGGLGAPRTRTVTLGGENVKADFTVQQPAAAWSRVSLRVVRGTARPDGSAPGLFRLRRSGDLSAALTVRLRSLGQAQPGVDYASLPARVTFAAGVGELDLPVTALPTTPLTAGAHRAVKLRVRADPSQQYQVSLPGQGKVLVWGVN